MSLLDLTPSFSVNWVKGEEVLPVLTYDPNTSTFSVTPWADGRVEIESAPGTVSWTAILIDGDYSLFVNSEGEVSANKFREVKPSLDIPKLEFLRTIDSVPERMATLAKGGNMGTAEVSEADIPAGDDHVRIYTNFSIEPHGGIYGQSIREIGLWSDEDGAYFTDEDGLLIEL